MANYSGVVLYLIDSVTVGVLPFVNAMSEPTSRPGIPWLLMLTSLCLLLFQAACDTASDDDSAPVSGETVNSIPLEEIEQSAVPTYDELESAFNSVVARDPDLLEDSPAFARAVFDEVKRLREDQYAAQLRVAASDLLKLTLAEWIVVLRDPFLTYLARDTPGLARGGARGVFPCDAELDEPFNDGKADAVRHAYWNALIAKRVADLFGVEEGLQYAEELATAHESESAGSALATRRRDMDLSNNAAGRAVFSANPEANDIQLLELIRSLRFEFVENRQAAMSQAQLADHFQQTQNV
ncbi:MAG: hypothetical protein AAGN64_16260, partial [Bacteroidota bacterium]